MPSGGEPGGGGGRPRTGWARLPTPRGRFVVLVAAFGGVLVSQVLGLAAHRSGELVRLRVSVIVLAAVFLVAVTVDYMSRARNGS